MILRIVEGGRRSQNDISETIVYFIILTYFIINML